MKGHWWCCPKCDWEPPEEFYYVDGGEAVNCSKYEKRQIIPDPPVPFMAYPIYSGYASSSYASYEFGINGHDWNEQHLCPNCLKQFIFSNSDF